jgi:hypothetical protein
MEELERLFFIIDKFLCAIFLRGEHVTYEAAIKPQQALQLGVGEVFRLSLVIASLKVSELHTLICVVAGRFALGAVL